MLTTRRDFLKLASGTAALAVFPALSRGAVSAKSAPAISLGHSLYGMQTVPLSAAVAHCARIGFKNIELMLDPGFTAEPKLLSKEARKALRRQLSDLGLSVSGLMRNLRLVDGMSAAENRDAIKEAAELAQDVAAGAMPPIETILGGTPGDWEEDKRRLADALVGWAAAADAADICIVVKAHYAQAVDTPEKLLWLLQQVPSPKLNVTFDYSHFEAQGLPLAPSWALLGPRTKFVHVKDCRKKDGKVVFVLAGEGSVDYRAYFRMLNRSDYHGPVVAEVSAMVFRQPGYDPIAAAEKCYRTLATALSQASEGA